MTETSAESNASNLPLIEKVTNTKSMFMIFVVLLMVDISLVQNFGKNLFTYEWQDMKIHFGKTAVIGAGWLFFYVVVSPLVSAFMVWLVLRIHNGITDWFKSLFKKKSPTDVILSEERIKAVFLKRWAIANEDSMAFDLAQERLEQHQGTQEENRKMHMATSAFILLTAWSFFVPGTLCGDLIVTTINSLNLFTSILVFATVFGVLALWWSSHYVDIYDDSTKVWYPKATKGTKGTKV